MLQDYSDCATFAYVTPLCLETHEWKCQNLQTAPWHNRSVILNTAVSLHKSGVATVDPWRLRHEQSYAIGQPGNYLVGKVSISMSAAMHIPPHLDISRSVIPASVQARIKEHLREKQCTNAPAHGVIVVARHPQLFSLGFQWNHVASKEDEADHQCTSIYKPTLLPTAITAFLDADVLEAVTSGVPGKRVRELRLRTPGASWRGELVGRAGEASWWSGLVGVGLAIGFS